jgi:hypothetical protein
VPIWWLGFLMYPRRESTVSRAGMLSSCLRSSLIFYLKNRSKSELQDWTLTCEYQPCMRKWSLKFFMLLLHTVTITLSGLVSIRVFFGGDFTGSPWTWWAKKFGLYFLGTSSKPGNKKISYQFYFPQKSVVCLKCLLTNIPTNFLTLAKPKPWVKSMKLV